MRHSFLKKFVTGTLAVAALGCGALAVAAETSPKLEENHWHFHGPFGTYDRAAAQRGYQVYKEVCAACHSLNMLSYRNLQDLGLSENQVKGLIADIQVPDLGDDGAASSGASCATAYAEAETGPPRDVVHRARPFAFHGVAYLRLDLLLFVLTLINLHSLGELLRRFLFDIQAYLW